MAYVGPAESFIDGLFSGAKSVNDLLKSRNELILQQRNLDAGEAARAKIEQGDTQPNVTRTPPTTPPATTGSSPPPETPSAADVPEGFTPKNQDFMTHAPLIQQYENASKNPYLGTGGKDLTYAPQDPETHFPIWDGVPTNVIDPRTGKRLNSTAAGLFQITKETWDPIARQLGITDFSPLSQWRVAEELYNKRGLQPWTVGNKAFADAVRGGVAGGGYASMTGGALPSRRMAAPTDTSSLPQVPSYSGAAPQPGTSALGQNYIPNAQPQSLTPAVQRLPPRAIPSPSPTVAAAPPSAMGITWQPEDI